MRKIIEEIKKYQEILLYRHVNPDQDAYGSQLGMYAFIRNNFRDKNVVLMGTMQDSLDNMFYPSGVPETKPSGKRALAIVVDTANRERVDGDLTLADEIIKIDHHLIVDQYGDLNYVREDASSCAEILTLLFNEVSDQYQLGKEGARGLYMGIVGDSNRFMYRHTTEKTFKAAQLLLNEGIDIEEIYAAMYVKHEKDLRVTKYILNHYVYADGVCYYYLSDMTLRELGISRNEGSNYVNTLADIAEFKIWAAITENSADHNIRVSLRSREYPVNEVARKYHGGGHVLASGATLNSLDELDELIADLKEVINHGHA